MFKPTSTLLLRIIFILIGLGVLSFFIIVIPNEVDFSKLGIFTILLVLMYISTIPFYFSLYQTMKLLNYIDKNKSFSNLTIKALQKIKYASLIFSLMYTIAIPFIFYIAQEDDAPGVGAIGLGFVFISAVAATIAAILQRLIQNGVDLKAENELTV